METDGLNQEDVDALIGARTAIEALWSETIGHSGDHDTYVCLACYRRAQQYVKAIDALGERLRERT